MKNKNGFYGEFGGSFMPPKVQEELDRIEKAYNELKEDLSFIKELEQIRHEYQGRPTPLTFAENLTTQIKGAKIYLKREDINHTGAHKINHTLGECLLARKLGKQKVIAETGAGQHGFALAVAAAKFGLECEIHMGAKDMKKQAQNVAKIKLCGAKIIRVSQGRQALPDAIESAFESYMQDLDNSIYCIGSTVGPHPFPTIVADLQNVVGKEAKKQIMEAEGELPVALVACVNGGSNAIALFNEFISDKSVKMYGVEPAGAASLTKGKVALVEGFRTLALLNENGEIGSASSIASGLEHPGTGPQHAYLKQIGRVKYVTIDDQEALSAFMNLTRTEGILPALESAHALAYTQKIAKRMKGSDSIICNLSGRGDKDADFICCQESL